ncbi:hypothetical protein [Lachnoclostridium sp. An118]|uniref:hypothetical protein n=1 Tax=Lachnoclostridium sp. An118 TaxID=1965547 RepID=UPI00117AF593|nr:hypothetical protein [Lachnoclostridium sp. An118]
MSGSVPGRLVSRAKNCKYRNLILLVSVLSLLGSAALLVSDAGRAAAEQRQIERNSYGQGEKTESFQITVDGERAEEALDITVGERQYTAEELQDIFDRAAEELEVLALGANESLDQVTEDLSLAARLPDLPIAVEWELDRYDVLTVSGEIQETALREALEEEPEGVLVNLKAFMTYTQDQTRQAVHEMTVRLCPAPRTKEEELLDKIRGKITEYGNENKTEEMIKLPEEVDGREISYHYQMDARGMVVLAMGAVTVLLLFCLERQNEKKDEEKKKQQMMMDYPQIVSQLNLLLGAGMSSKSAWKKIVDDYQRRKPARGTRAAYEEMASTWNEMCGGVPEKDCYESFGSRCGLQDYMKLGALLSQNLRRGTKGLADALRLEGLHAFEERKALARRRGEEAGTRLLLPMFLMLAVVLVIVIVPAFLSISL